MSDFAELADLPRLVPKGARILGLDLGSKQIGIALSDVGLRVASPMIVIKRQAFTQTAEEVEKIIAAKNIGALVIGLPLEMSGKEGPAAQSAREFGRNLLKRDFFPIAYMDERLSTSAVERTLLEADQSRARRAEVIDKMAAAYLLQAALDVINQ